MSNSLKIGVVGLGTVGLGTLKILLENANLISMRAGKSLIVTSVSAKNKDLDRGFSLKQYTWYDNPLDLVLSPDVDVVVELVGGGNGIAKTICEEALSAGKHLVTANKALIAQHGVALSTLAMNNQVQLNYEAAVAGAIPIVKVLRESLVGNRIDRIYGILNGTCNYILTKMRDTNRSFQDVLTEAQDLGFAESDPIFDISGTDTAHKLSILSSLAFGTLLNFDGVEIQGIEDVTSLDIQFAKELGYGIKLLGVASLVDQELSQYVHPCLVPINSPINHVDGSFNAVVISGNFLDTLVLEGKGAGAGPTSSAVVGDLVDIARGSVIPPLGVNIDQLVKANVKRIKDTYCAYYVRLTVEDKSGVLAEITSILHDQEISIESVIQRGCPPGKTVSVVMTLHDTHEHLIYSAMKSIAKLESVVEKERIFRIEKV